MPRDGSAPQVPRLRSRWGALGLGAMAVVVALGGCADSGYHYVKNSDEGVYFKVPESWHLFELQQEAQPEDRPDALDLGGEDKSWVVVFDASGQPAITHAEEAAPTEPVGVAQIFPLSSGDRDAVTLGQVRALATLEDAGDPLTLISKGDPSIEAISYEDIVTGDGHRGNRIVFNQRLKDGTWVTIDHTVMFDAATAHLYRFVVRCTSACFKANQQQIDTIADSWRIGKDG